MINQSKERSHLVHSHARGSTFPDDMYAYKSCDKERNFRLMLSFRSSELASESISGPDIVDIRHHIQCLRL